MARLHRAVASPVAHPVLTRRKEPRNASSCPCPREISAPSGSSSQPQPLLSPGEGCWLQMPSG